MLAIGRVDVERRAKPSLNRPLRSMFWTMDRRPVGRRAGSGPGAQARFDETSRVGDPLPLSRRATDESVVGGSLERVIRASSRKSAPPPRRLRQPPASLPRSLASDTGGVAASRRHASVARHRLHQDVPRGEFPAHRSTGTAHGAVPPWRREFDGSLCRGGRACRHCGQLIGERLLPASGVRGVFARHVEQAPAAPDPHDTHASAATRNGGRTQLAQKGLVRDDNTPHVRWSASH